MLISTTVPKIEPISLDALATHLRIDDESMVEDELLTDIIKAGREQVEHITSRAVMTQTWDYYLDTFPSVDYFKLPFGNLQSVTHVKYTDSDGTQTTMTETTDYLVETNGTQCGRIVLPYDTDWPTFTAYPSNPIVVRFVCGWTTRALVPSKIKSAVKMICTDLYENREFQMVGSLASNYKVNRTVQLLLNNWVLREEF